MHKGNDIMVAEVVGEPVECVIIGDKQEFQIASMLDVTERSSKTRNKNYLWEAA